MSKQFTAKKLAWLDALSDDEKINPSTFRLAYALAMKFLNEAKGYAYPSQSTLGKACRLKERVVRDNLDSLDRNGYINRRRGTKKGETTLYYITQPDRQKIAGPSKEASGEKLPVQRTVERRKTAGAYRQKTAVNIPLLNPLESNESGKPLSPPVVSDAEDAFETFWQAYPRRENKGAARKAFRTALTRNGITEQTLIEGASRYASERHGEEQRWTKHPATWLEKECWADDPAPKRSASNTNRANGVVNMTERLAEKLRSAQ